MSENGGENIRRKAYAIAVAVFLAVLFVPVSMVVGAGSITLNPTAQAPGAAVSVSGTGFGGSRNIGIGFGPEVTISNETVVSVAVGDVRDANFTRRPIKAGSVLLHIVAIAGSLQGYEEDIADNGAGGLYRTRDNFFFGDINYASGSYHRVGVSTNPAEWNTIASYTSFQYNVSSFGGITTTASGTFSANITVPAVTNGNYNVTAIDSSGNRAVTTLSVTGWSRTYGGSGNDIGTGDTIQTSDGGYAVSGDTNSFGAGGTDFWLFKTDASGNMLWNKTYGGPLAETCGDMCQTTDGGFALAGNTVSFGAGGQDVYLVRTDANGNMLWNKTYGGSGNEYSITVVQTADGGYAMVGYTSSYGAGNNDVYLIKTDTAGIMQWNKTYGGPNADLGYGLVQNSAGGYTFSGYTSSFGAGLQDVWLAKTDASGNMLWNKTYGGNSTDQGYDLVQTFDGGYAMTGFTMAFGGRSALLIRTDANGNMLWNKTYNETNSIQMGLHLIQTADTGFAVVGWNYANGQDLLLIKTDSAGSLQFNTTYGGPGVDNGYAILQTGDGGYLLTGTTNSFGAGLNDVWLIKTDAAGVVPEFSSWLLLSLALVATGFIVFSKKRLSRRL